MRAGHGPGGSGIGQAAPHLSAAHRGLPVACDAVAPRASAALVVLLAMALLTGACGVPRSAWEFERELLAADRLADYGHHEDAYQAYEALAWRSHREDLLRYIQFRLGLMRERQGRYDEALTQYRSLWAAPMSLYDEEAGRALLRSALIARDALGMPAEGDRLLEGLILTLPNTAAADDAFVELIDVWRESGTSRRIVAFTSEHYPSLANTEIADNFVYWTGRVLQDDLGEPAAALELYWTVISRFHRSALVDDAVWRSASALRSLDRIDEEYGLLMAFIDAREVSWIMADYDSVYYVPALFRLAEIHEERGELVEAIAVWRRYQTTFFLSLRVDDVQYHVMELQRRLGDIRGMRASLQWLRDEHPRSRYVRQGEELLAATEAEGAGEAP